MQFSGTFARGVLPRIRWSAIVGGALAALAVQLVLGLFGAALGLESLSNGSRPGAGAVIAALVISFVSFLIGGNIATRLSGAVHPRAAYLHGILVWCAGIITAAVLLGGAIGAASSRARPAADEPQAAAREDQSAKGSAGAGLAALCGLVGACVGALGARRGLMEHQSVRYSQAESTVATGAPTNGSQILRPDDMSIRPSDMARH